MPTGTPVLPIAGGGQPLDSPGPVYTCTLCGCLCDDLVLVADSGRIVEAERACGLARPFLLGMETTKAATLAPRLYGRDATESEAVEEAARILATARSLLILGLKRSTNETVREAVGLADLIGATIEVGDPRAAWPRIAAFQRGGAVGGTLGEVKARADVIVFWGCDPASTHPRHFERYSADAPGRFATGGRRIVVIGDETTDTARRADLVLALTPEREVSLLLALRALVREVPLDPGHVEATTGHGLAVLLELAETLQGARYGAWFLGSMAGRGPVDQAESRHQAVTALVRELGRRTRFIALGLGESGNAHGAEAVLGWQSGFVPGVDFAAGRPESLPAETSAVGRLDRGEFDCSIVVGGGGMDALTDDQWSALEEKSLIFLGDPGHEAYRLATVALPAGTPGIDDSGTFTRVDGVSLPVRAFRPSSTPSEAEWLRRLRSAVVDSGGKTEFGSPGSAGTS